MSPPIEGYKPQLDLERKDWPLSKRRLGIYPPWEQGLGGETGDSETDKPLDAEDEGQSEGDEQDVDDTFDDEIGEDDWLDNEELEQELDKEWEPEDELYLPPAPIVQKQLAPVDDRQFSSWWEFVQSAIDESLVGWKGRRSSREVDSEYGRIRGDLPWHGTDTWEEAVDMAVRKGWPDGKKMLEDSLAVVRPKVEPFKSIEMSVAGAYPMVPNYAAGDPECMVIDPGSDIRHARPIIRIDYCNWTHAGVTPKDMMLRGAAVVSLA